MPHDWLNLDELARKLGRDRRLLEKQVNRGRIPAHKVGGEWRFNLTEITHWLEAEMRDYSEEELARLEVADPSDEVPRKSPITALLKPELCEVPLQARTKRSALEAMIEVAGRTWQVWEPSELLAATQEREAVLSTAFENGVAIPHPRNPHPDAIGESLIAYGRTFSGIPFGAPKRVLTDVFFLVLCRDTRTHLQVLARLARMIQLPEFLDHLREVDDPQDSWTIIKQADEQLG